MSKEVEVDSISKEIKMNKFRAFRKKKGAGGLILGLSAIAVTCSCMTTTAARADDFVRIYNSYGTSGGGEFEAIISNQAGNASLSSFANGVTPSATGTAFQSGNGAPEGTAAAPGKWEAFCLEDHETMSYGNVYHVDINPYAQGNAGSGGNYNSQYGSNSQGRDYLSDMTKYLYAGFIKHALTTGYDYGSGATRTANANALQEVIWYLEDEISGTLSSAAQAYYDEADQAVNHSNGGFTGWQAAIKNVFVANLYTESVREEHQSQLVWVPLPLPASMAAVGLLGVAFISRRRIGKARA